MKFSKYHALGNDYIVLDPRHAPGPPDPAQIRLICDRHRGVGSDGILWGPLEVPGAWGLRIYNPDGSEAEKSGNGLRIFARYLWDAGLVGEPPFAIDTPGGRVSAQIIAGGGMVRVEIGRVSFASQDIPVAGPPREVLNETLAVGACELVFCAATVGNPHCVVRSDVPSQEQALRLGPLIERHPLFPNRTNVQFMRVLARDAIQIEIWERGAGYTLASGTSSVAAAAVAHRLGYCGADITVHMPGGRLEVRIGDGFQAILTGPVTRVCEGDIHSEMLEV